MTQPAPPLSSASDTSRLQHDINNRIQALLLGIDLLTRSDDDEVRFIARELRAELDDLQALLQKQSS
jgi:hypothetical protein